MQDLRLEAIPRAFKMFVNFPTHLSGSVIDHIYIKKELADAVQIRMSTEEKLTVLMNIISTTFRNLLIVYI